MTTNYMFRITQIEIDQVHSPSKDTDFVTLSVKVGDQMFPPVTKFVGDVGYADPPSRGERMNGNTPVVRIRFWLQVTLSAAALLLMVVTLISPEWIEFLTGWDPDHGNGGFEWVVVAVLGLVAIGLGVSSRAEWRRLRTT